MRMTILFSILQLQYTIARIHSSERAILPVIQASVPWWGILPLSADSKSLSVHV